MPKGVRGRHYSLTHFYPWMKQEFNLTDKEKFTMLSGIAHDPIQRDSKKFLENMMLMFFFSFHSIVPWCPINHSNS